MLMFTFYYLCRLQNAMSTSQEHEDKYQASHPNLRKLNTDGERFIVRALAYCVNILC